jgi:pimeloyl-ACP methyl ester carboxylesterase
MSKWLPHQRWKDVTAARLRAGSRVAPIARGAVEYAIQGDGPAVLVSHGTPGGYDQGLLVARLLGSQRFRFVAVSRPGYLGTPLDVGPTPEQQADAFAALLDALAIDRTAVIGLSGGGPSALQFALRHPRRCWAVVLVSAITRRRPASERPLLWKFLHSVVLTSDFGGWLLRVPSRASRQLGRLLRLPAQQASAAEVVDTIVPESLRGAGHRNDSAQFGMLPVYPLEAITAPALVVHGTADWPVPFAHAEFAARGIRGCELIAVTGAGHGVLFRRQGDVRARIIGFLEAHMPAGDGSAGKLCS